MLAISLILVCKSGYDKVGNLCYIKRKKLVDVNWNDAKVMCDEEGDELATIPNTQLNNLMDKYIDEHRTTDELPNERYWIGML